MTLFDKDMRELVCLRELVKKQAEQLLSKDEAVMVLVEARALAAELNRQIIERCESDGGEGNMDTSAVAPLLKRIDALTGVKP